jgi:LEA14-like dessication related protein
MLRSSHPRPLFLVAGAALHAAAAGQAAVERVVSPPSAALRGVQVTGVGLNGATLAVTLALANPNPYPLTAARASYRLLSGDSTEVGRGTAAEPLRVAANDSAVVTLPLEVNWNAFGRVGRGAVRGGAVEYRILGEVVAATPIGERAVPLDARGRFAPLGPAR